MPRVPRVPSVPLPVPPVPLMHNYTHCNLIVGCMLVVYAGWALRRKQLNDAQVSHEGGVSPQLCDTDAPTDLGHDRTVKSSGAQTLHV